MRRAWACWLAVGAAALAGCGGSSGPKSNGVADMTPTQIISEMHKVVASAKSVHISGSGTTNGKPIELDLRLAGGKGGGHVDVGGYRVDLVRIENKLYFKADHKTLNHYAGSVVANLLADRWIVVPAGSGGFGAFTPFTNLKDVTHQILTASGRVEKGDETKIDGQSVIALHDSGKGGTLYVDTTGPAYPLSVKPSGSNSGTITFSDWNQPVTVTAPQHALDYKKLTGG